MFRKKTREPDSPSRQMFQRSFGTFPLTGEKLLNALACAITVGYRSFDTAQMYSNEEFVGVALKSSGLRRDEFCIVTKVHPDNFSDDRCFFDSVEQSLAKLQLDAVDVLLLHWPPSDGDITPSLRRLQRAQEIGLAKEIGVANYTIAMLARANAILDVPLFTNQVEFHPLLDQSRLLSGATALGVRLSAYCSVARGEVFKYPIFDEIGARHTKTAAQVAQRWILQKGVDVTTMSTKIENIRANFEITDFMLSDRDIREIDALGRLDRRIVTSKVVPWAPAWD